MIKKFPFAITSLVVYTKINCSLIKSVLLFSCLLSFQKLFNYYYNIEDILYF